MKIGMIVAHQNFRDEEYFAPARIFLDHGVEVVTISTDLSPAQGKLGGVAPVDITLDKVALIAFDAILFIGGPGARVYVDNPLAHQIARDALSSGNVLGAICMAPLILAYAGVLTAKTATIFPGDKVELQSKGVHYSDAPVVQDGKIITADGPASAEAFAHQVLSALGIKRL